MKKKLLGIAFTTFAALTVGVSLNVHNKQTAKVEAYSVTPLPTTIDLNDSSSSNIRNYYSSLNNLSTSERSGTNLLKNLKPILKNGQKYLSYDGTSASTGKAIWDVYCIVDRDWNKSPASALPSAAGTYNSSTNKITGYNWGANTSTYENPYLHALYYNRDKTVIAQAYGDHNNNTSTGINREHIWPKGAGFDDTGSGGARGDIMHLWAANGHTNNIHSNNFYGYVDTSKSYTDIGDTSTYSMCAGNLSGKSKTFTSSSNTVFEPQDSDKGDIARACFYMVARYNYLSGSDSDGIDSNNPNLELVNNVTDFQSSGYTSTTSSTGKLGILQDLLEWNRLDPPDEWEIHRNNLCYNNFTNNRNPFIDFPEWAEYIWGKSENGSYNSSSTGYATPNSDTINDFSSDTPVTKTLSSISVSGQTTSFTQGDAFSFGGTVTATYSDSTTANVTSSATFSGYNMSTTGNQTVTVSYTEDGVTKSTTYQITVSAASVSSITATINDSKTFYVGETITKSDITVTTNAGVDVTDSVAFSDYQFSYEDAVSGGSLTNKTFSISYGNLSTTLISRVQRKAHQDITNVSDTLDRSFTGVSNTTYTSWSNKSAPNSNAVYAGHSAGGNTSIQLRSTKTSNTYSSGIVSTTSGGALGSVSVTWNSNTSDGRTLNVYGKNTAYSSPNDLYDDSAKGTLLGTIVKGTSTSLTITGSYTYVGICSNSGAMYLTDVTFAYGGEDTPTNVANYIMYEDTNGQCNTKFDVAKGYFESLSKDDRATFMTSSDYVISTARTRLEAWASYLGKTISYVDGDYIVSTSKNVTLLNNIVNNDNMISAIIVISLVSITAIGGYFFLRHKKEQE